MSGRKLVDSLETSAVVTDATGVILHANSAALRAAGQVRLIGRTLEEFIEDESFCTVVVQDERTPREDPNKTWNAAENAERLRVVTGATGVGLFDRQILAADAPPPWWSDTMRHMLGFPDGRHADPQWFFDRVHPEDQARMQVAVDRANEAAGDGSVEVEVRWSHPDGAELVLLIRSITLPSEADGSIRSFGIVMDVTEQRSRVAALRELEDRVRHMQKMDAIGRLAGGVAHDFNNLLSVILGVSDLTLDDLGTEHPSATDVRSIREAASRAADLTRQLLAFGRKQILQPRVIELAAFLDELSPLVSRMLEDSVALELFPTDPSLSINVDPSQLTQVILNLVLNARDAMPNGGSIVVEASAEQVDAGDTAQRLAVAPGTYAVLSISDDGEGMDQATLARVFEPFFTTKAPGQGTGLGLATVYGIVRQSGGSIWVYSERGMGTTFKVYLPATNQPATAPVDTMESNVFEADGTILLAEDDPDVREVVTRILKRAGFEVLCGASPQETLELAHGFGDSIDLLLTDVLMPGMTGKQLAASLHEKDPTLPVLFMSGYTENSIVHHGVLDEGVRFIAKPITPARLLKAVAMALVSSRDDD